MKYFSLIVFVFALVWTWSLIHSQSLISFETHSNIQTELSKLITNTVQSKRPSASEIKVKKIWTQAIGLNEIRALFTYSFKDVNEDGSTSHVEIQAQGLLEKQVENEGDSEKWTLIKMQANNNLIVFDEGLIIQPGEEDSGAIQAPPSSFNKGESSKEEIPVEDSP